MSDKMLTEAEAAVILGCHPGTMQNWRRWLRGPPYTRQKVEGRRVIRYSEPKLRAWAKETGWFKGAGNRRSRDRDATSAS